jgi:predicted RNA binding protein YcfA (HicA-like mRNA interferase family)
MQRAESVTGSVTVVVPDHSEVKVGTLLSIIRQSRVPRTAFETQP